MKIPEIISVAAGGAVLGTLFTELIGHEVTILSALFAIMICLILKLLNE